MRKALLEDLEARIEEAKGSCDPKSEDDLPYIAREMLVERFGPQCSAWVVMKHRRMLRAAGAFDVVVPAHKRDGSDYEMPMWFALAVAFLRKRKDWSVDVLAQRGARRFRVRWHAWRRQAPEAALRRLGT